MVPQQDQLFFKSQLLPCWISSPHIIASPSYCYTPCTVPTKLLTTCTRGALEELAVSSSFIWLCSIRSLSKRRVSILRPLTSLGAHETDLSISRLFFSRELFVEMSYIFRKGPCAKGSYWWRKRFEWSHIRLRSDSSHRFDVDQEFLKGLQRLTAKADLDLYGTIDNLFFREELTT